MNLLNNADSNRFSRNTILTSTTSTSTNFAGYVISASETSATTTGNTMCDANVIDSNTVIGGYYSITCVGSTTVANQNNVITNNNISDSYLYGIYLSGNYNSLVEHNDISRPTRATVSTHYGIYVTSLNVSVNISKNRIHSSFGGDLNSTSIFYGIYFTGVDALAGLENIVSNNAIYNIISNGSQYGFYNTSSSNVHYYHNTISLDDAGNTSNSVSYVFYQTTLSEGIDVKDNLITISRSGGGNNVGLYFNTSTSTITSNYNDLYITGTDAYVGYLSGLHQTLTQWQAASAQDANSLSTNPFYSSIATGNLTPMSPVLDDKGTPISGITTDILDASRSALTPDIGAWEFFVPPCTAPPVAGVASAMPFSGICMGTSVNLSVLGNSIGSAQTYQWEFSTSAAGPWSPLGGVHMFPDTTILATPQVQEMPLPVQFVSMQELQ